MDREAIKKVKQEIIAIAGRNNISLDRVIIFGSRVKDKQTPHSDVDIVIVSTSFGDLPWYKRPGPFYREWDYENLPEPELICLTPEEFEERKDRQAHIVSTALKEGIEVS